MSTEASYTIDEFCKAERISRAFLYKLWAKGNGPRYYLVGTVRRISHQARLEWHRQLEAAAESGDAAHRGEIPAISKRILMPQTVLERMLEGSR
jgi:hypothetical protein